MNRFAALLTPFLLLAQPAAAIEIEAVTSAAGRSAWLVQEHSIPFSSIEVIFTGGATLDPLGREGAVSLMTSLMTEGAGDLDAQGFAAALESLAGDVSFSAGRDSVSMSIRALSENREQVLDLAMLALTEARFDPESLERLRAQTIASLQRSAQDPGSIAGNAFAAAGYAGHAYGTPTDGTLDSIAAITLDDILAAHRAVFNGDLVFVGAAGDLTNAELGAIVDRITADLPPSNTALPAYHSFDAPPGLSVIDFPGPQSVIQFGHAGIHWDDADFLPAYVMNEIFGGGRFGTRLMTELREERGLTYGISTWVGSGRFGDVFAGQFSTANETAGQAIALVREQFDWLANGGITQADLERAQTYLTGAYPLRFDGNDSIANILATMQFQSFPIDYVNVRNDRVRAVTLADIQRVAQRLAGPETLSFVVVGQPQGLE